MGARPPELGGTGPKGSGGVAVILDRPSAWGSVTHDGEDRRRPNPATPRVSLFDG